MQNKQVEAVAVLEKLYDPDSLKNEIEQLSAEVEKEFEQNKSKIGFLDLFKTTEIRLALLAGIGLQV